MGAHARGLLDWVRGMQTGTLGTLQGAASQPSVQTGHLSIAEKAVAQRGPPRASRGVDGSSVPTGPWGRVSELRPWGVGRAERTGSRGVGEMLLLRGRAAAREEPGGLCGPWPQTAAPVPGGKHHQADEGCHSRAEGVTGRRRQIPQPFSALGIEVPVEVAGGGVGRGRI